MRQRFRVVYVDHIWADTKAQAIAGAKLSLDEDDTLFRTFAKATALPDMTEAAKATKNV